MKSKIILILVGIMMLSACGKKSSSNVPRTGRGGNSNLTVGAAPNPGTGSTTCGQQQAAWGRIFSQSMSSQQFTQQLISFTGNQEIGLVDSNYNSASTGVDMQLSAVFSGNQFNPTASKLLIRIVDSNSFTMGRLDDIALSGQSGQIIGNGSFQANYTDQFGTVTLRGQRDNANMIYGQVSFQNTDGTSGQLGEFYVAGCSLVGI